MIVTVFEYGCHHYGICNKIRSDQIRAAGNTIPVRRNMFSLRHSTFAGQAGRDACLLSSSLAFKKIKQSIKQACILNEPIFLVCESVYPPSAPKTTTLLRIRKKRKFAASRMELSLLQCRSRVSPSRLPA